MRRIRTWLARREIFAARQEAFLRGLIEGREERPMTCGLPRRDHCHHSYIYDPGH